ncbi:hypothetical protein BH23ACT10_BH23ACT10_25100 [soil metagenome]
MDRIVAAEGANRGPVDEATTVEVRDNGHQARAAADILATIDSLTRLAGGVSAAPADALSLVAWVVEEVESQAVGLPSRRYTPGRPTTATRCPLLCASERSDGTRPMLHACGHQDLSSSEVELVRRLAVASALSVSPGARLDQLVSRLQMPRRDVLDELGELIALGAAFGIGYHWYVYDFVVLVRSDIEMVGRGCRCPTGTSW